jgi:hypothetical protein
MHQNNMFPLEEAIAAWRDQMLAAGIQTPVPLDELENHLRDDIQDRMQAGASRAAAFQLAVNQIGQPDTLQSEFSKINQRKIMKKGTLIAAAVIGIMVGMALVLPAVAQYRQEGVMRNAEPWLFLIGSLLTLAGCAAGVRSLAKSRA